LTKEELRWISRLAPSDPVVCPFGRDSKEALERLMEAQRGLEANWPDRFAKAGLRLWVYSVILGAVRELTAPHPPTAHVLVVAAQDYLQRHLAEHIRMPDLVKHIGLGHTQLFHLFKSATGLTPNDYLMRVRVEKAKELLAHPAPSVTDIALATGFSSGQYFSNVFRKYAGQTPREYRRVSCRQTGA
jgi:transcriptional regulator GlxA family with amidase domain